MERWDGVGVGLRGLVFSRMRAFNSRPCKFRSDWTIGVAHLERRDMGRHRRRADGRSRNGNMRDDCKHALLCFLHVTPLIPQLFHARGVAPLPGFWFSDPLFHPEPEHTSYPRGRFLCKMPSAIQEAFSRTPTLCLPGDTSYPRGHLPPPAIPDPGLSRLFRISQILADLTKFSHRSFRLAG